MNELIEISQPEVPANWDYKESVNKVGQLIYNWRNLTNEIAQELWIARTILKNQGRRTDLSTKVEKLPTWSQYCKDIGSQIDVVNRWLKQWFPQPKTVLEVSQNCDTCTISDLYSLIEQGRTFGTIYADPPWNYDNQGTRAATSNHYKSMTPNEIAALPIVDLTNEQCHLHLWTTNAFLFECPAIMEAWGFEYKGVFVWAKKQMGIGNYWRVSHEFLLLGVKGNLSFLKKDEMSWIELPRGKHSSKPEEIVDKIEQVSPGPYLELFGRKGRKNWTVWGNEITRTLFDGQ
jgi:N6-adenosine-specific RNA methylase IME4